MACAPVARGCITRQNSQKDRFPHSEKYKKKKIRLVNMGKVTCGNESLFRDLQCTKHFIEFALSIGRVTFVLPRRLVETTNDPRIWDRIPLAPHVRNPLRVPGASSQLARAKHPNPNVLVNCFIHPKNLFYVRLGYVGGHVVKGLRPR